jgi:ATP-dependent Lhr-like helicase
VIQIDAPPTVASFLQRMGRTGRRAGSSRNCLFLTTTNEALLITAGVLRLWSEGFVEQIVPSPRPLHILAQQILSLVLQQSGLPENRWSGWVGKTFAQLGASEACSLVKYMKSTGVLAEDQGVLGIGPLGEASLGRRNFLELMSAFTTPLLLSARHGNTELGEVAPTTLTTQRDEPTILLLGGRSWRVTEVDWRRRLAWVEPSEEGGRSLWPGSSRFIPYASCRAIEAAVVARALSVELSNRARTQFDELCDEFAFCDGVSIPLVVDPKGCCRLWTFAGSAVNGALTRAISASGLQIRRFDNFGISIRSNEPSLIPSLVDQLDPGNCLPSIPDNLHTALKFSMCLPPGVASAILTERLRDKKGLAATLKRPVRLVRAEQEASA